MGRAQIIEKLDVFLGKRPIFVEESEVIYFFVEARKFMEQENQNNYPLLKFYSDWCVHSKKDKITKQIREIMEGVYQDMLLIDRTKFQDTNQDIMSFADMDDLRKDIERFLTLNSLPDNFIVDLRARENFTNLLIQILVDQPLENPCEKIKSLAFKQTTPDTTAIIEIKYEKEPAKYDTFVIKRGHSTIGQPPNKIK